MDVGISFTIHHTVRNYDMKLANSYVARMGRRRKTFPLSIFKRRETNTNSLLPSSAVDGGGGGLLFHSEGGGWTREREDFSSPKKAPEYSERKKRRVRNGTTKPMEARERKVFSLPLFRWTYRKEMMLFVVMQYDKGNWTTKVRHFPINGSGEKRYTHESIIMVVIFFHASISLRNFFILLQHSCLIGTGAKECRVGSNLPPLFYSRKIVHISCTNLVHS